MQFKDENELEEFLTNYLEDLGLECRRQVVLPSGRIDIITNHHVIECKHRLKRASMIDAMGQLMGYKPYCSGRRLVIAGLGDEKSLSLKTAYEAEGIEVWFIDEISEIVNYYHRLQEKKERAERRQYAPFSNSYYSPTPNSTYSGYSSFEFENSVPWIIGAAIVFVFLAFLFSGSISPTDPSLLLLHRAAENYDIDTGRRAIDQLFESESICNRRLAYLFEVELDNFSERAFNRLNEVTKRVNDAYSDCSIPILRHQDQTYRPWEPTRQQ